MRVLVACEWSGRVRDQFRTRGHDAYSCDLDAPSMQSEFPEYHYQTDVRDVLSQGWDLIIGFPPCTYLSNAGNGWPLNTARLTARCDAIDLVKAIWNAPCDRVAIENPIGVLSREWHKPTQIVQPYWFGDPYTKKTCLWLRGLAPLVRDPDHYVHGPVVPWIQNRPETGGVCRGNNSKIRGKTFVGLARAMAKQWGDYGN